MRKMETGMGDYFIETKVKLLVDMQLKKMAGDMQKMAETIAALNQEILMLKSQVNERRDAPKPIFVAPEPMAAPAASVVSSAPKNGEQLRPRYGDYKPEDVSIGKFFYYGGK